MELKITSEMQQYINEIIQITEGDEYDSLESLILDALHALQEIQEARMKELGAQLHKALESGPISLEEAMGEIYAELGIVAEDPLDGSSMNPPVVLSAEAKQDLKDIIQSYVNNDDRMNVPEFAKEETAMQSALVESKESTELLDRNDKVESDWAQVNREAVLETAYSRLFPFERDLALHVGLVLSNNKIRIKCIVDADVGKWLEARENWEADINGALRSFMNYRSKQPLEIQQLSMDLLPLQDDPDIVYDINDSFHVIYDNDWIFYENEAFTILTLDFDLVDWYQSNYGLRYEFQIAKVIREFMESEL